MKDHAHFTNANSGFNRITSVASLMEVGLTKLDKTPLGMWKRSLLLKIAVQIHWLSQDQIYKPRPHHMGLDTHVSNASSYIRCEEQANESKENLHSEKLARFMQCYLVDLSIRVAIFPLAGNVSSRQV